MRAPQWREGTCVTDKLPRRDVELARGNIRSQNMLQIRHQFYLLATVALLGSPGLALAQIEPGRDDVLASARRGQLGGHLAWVNPE